MVNLGIGFDPGKTTGIAVCQFTPEGKFDGWLTVTQVDIKDMPEWFAKFNETHENDTVRIVVFELWRTFRQYAVRQTGSTQPASQVIGMIKMWWAGLRPKPSIEEQKSDVLNIGYKWLDMKQPSDHSKSHRFDAMAHLYYWMVQNNRAEPKIQSFKERFGTESGT